MTASGIICCISLLYLIRNWFRWDAKGTWMILLSIPINVKIPLLYAYLSKILTQTVEQQSHLDLIFRQVLLVSGLFILAHWFGEYVQVKSRSFQLRISMNYASELMQKLISMDYARLESYEGRAAFERCRAFAFEPYQADGAWAAVRLTGLLTSLLGLVSYSVLLAFIHPVLLLIILGMTLVEFLVSLRLIKVGNLVSDAMVNEEMKFSYFYRIAQKKRYAKYDKVAVMLMRSFGGALHEE